MDFSSGDGLVRGFKHLASSGAMLRRVEFMQININGLFLGPTQDTERDLGALCQLWLDSKDFIVKVAQRFNTDFTTYIEDLCVCV